MTKQSSPRSCRYRFGSYDFESGRGLLWRDGVLVPLTPRTAEVLRVLLEHRGEVVEKSDLLRFVWPNSFVEENNLAKHISTLRKVLEERRGQHDIISTIPGHGYMFVAPVTEADAVPAPVEPVAVAPPSDVPVPEAPAPPSPEIARPSWSGVAVAAALVAGVSLAVTFAAQRGARIDRSDVNVRQLTFEGQLQRDPAWSADGTALVYATDRAGNLDLYRHSMADPTPVRLTSDPADDSQADWSPDGRWLAFRSERDGGGIYVMPAGGGAARRVSDTGSLPRWSRDGTKLLLTVSNPVGVRSFRIVTLAGGAVQVVRPDLVDGFRSASAAWHPDGRRISIAGRRADAPWAFVTISVDGGEATTSRLPEGMLERLGDRRNQLGQFLWARSGTALFLEGRIDGAYSIWRANVDRRTLAWIGEPVRLYSGPGEFGDLAISPDGNRLAFTVSNVRTRVWGFPFDPAAARLTGSGQPLTPGGPGEYDAAAPLDGSKVAYRTVRGDRYELWQHSVNGGGEHLVSSSSDWMPTSPRWSRDGTQLAYLRRLPQGRPEVHPAVAIHTEGGAERLLQLPVDTEVVPDDWSADNAWLLGACRRAPGQPMGTCLVPVATTGSVADVRLVAADTSRSLMCQRFSPDERWISFMAVDQKHRDVSTLYVMPAAGGEWVPLTDGRQYDDKPRWSPDGRAVYFLSARDGAVNLWGQRFDTARGAKVGEPFRVTSFRGAQLAIPRDLARVEIAISANQLFLPIAETSGAIWMLDGLNRE
jgi:Tol biopolymer transport system component/DNA-binding winged helix-turn-helix (wHTH) protein